MSEGLSIEEIISALKAWFPPQDYKERELPGGGKWFFLPWQTIRERLDAVCPEWQVAYSSPVFLGDYCTITCTITIQGIAKQGVGNAEIVLLSSSGRNMARGTPIERATADAFKNAAENWGVARHLDEQIDPGTKADFIRYMQQKGDGRAAAFYHRNEGSVPDRPKQTKGKAKPFGASTTAAPTTAAPTPVAPVQQELISAPVVSNLDRLRNVNRLLGVSRDEGDQLIKTAIAALYEGKMTADLIDPELRNVRDRVLVLWAKSKFDPAQVSESRLMEWFLSESLGGESDAELVQLWLKVIHQKQQKYKSVI